MHLKTITLTVYRRPYYLRDCLASLARNDLTGYRMIIGLEPGNNDCVSICEQINFIEKHIIKNTKVLGDVRNTLSTLDAAFNQGSDFNLALEEDVVLSPDAFNLANWFCELHARNYILLNLFSPESDEHFPVQIIESKSFYPLGWAMHRNFWPLLKQNWYAVPGWDFSVRDVLKKSSSLSTLMPRFSRSNHIGRENGTYCTPELHDQLFSNVLISHLKMKGFSL